jgi:succinate-semialdehyde dehydrogenase/glutarate-semialdehyde dehydrogenase|tara:strand:+ start:3023 stop:4489 length:1467 start_codon:yes stop_codon:yes gene_type:complete
MTLTLKDQELLQSKAFINGAWVDAKDGATMPVTNPANGELIGTVPDMGAVETAEAIDVANVSWASWRSITAKERAKVLHRWFELIMQAQDDLALIMTAEQGKPLAEAKGEVAYGANFIEWFSEEAKRSYGDVIPSHGVDKRIIVIKQPIGVVAAITPWNFPIAMITRKVGPALAAGCPVVVKPSEDTPLSALALCVLAKRAGLPDGLLNVVTCSKPNAIAVGGELTSSKIVRKVSFTGSTAVGKLLMRQSSDTIKKVSLELGGNAPFIVFDDADLDAAIEGVLASKYRNTGQTCVCANRILVQDGVYDDFVARLSEAVSKFKVGPGLEGDTQQGPLINKAALAKVQAHVDDAVAKGGRIVLGGKPHSLGGTFFEPTIIADATTDMIFAKEETFGPLAPIFRFTTEEEAIEMANDTEFGLSSYFYSENMARIWRVAEALETGMVGINEGIISTEVAPFGGIKSSGLGREGSRYGMDDYLEMKYLCMGGL